MKSFPGFLLCFLFGSAFGQEADVAFFESKIRPVLAENCYKCHSASAAADGKLKGGLQLDTRAGIRKGGETGPAVEPGNSAESLILGALRHESDLKMPPKSKLSPDIAADFQKWIEMGAPDPRDGEIAEIKADGVDIAAGQKHWAFRPLAKLSTPKPPIKSGSELISTASSAPVRKHPVSGPIRSRITAPWFAGRILISLAFPRLRNRFHYLSLPRTRISIPLGAV